MDVSLEQAQADYRAFAARGLNLDITRGKPAPEQLDLSADLLTNVTGDDFTSPSGIDTRNYGGLDGLKELREIFGELYKVPTEQILAQGSSSLTLEYMTLDFAKRYGTPTGGPWTNAKILCPVPGYDRHFQLAEALGYELITIRTDDEGPVMDDVRRYVADPDVRAMWLVPMYSNPTGTSISEARARELAEINAAADDFTLLWDNAYGLHHLSDDNQAPMVDILSLCAEAGHPDRPWIYASTSKMTFAGAGVAFFASSPAVIEWYRAHMGAAMIGPDKINQLRHLRFFRDADGVREHMRRHAEIIRPKFEAVLTALENGLSSDIASWTQPNGGYFITLRVPNGTASKVVKYAAEAGVALTPAGSTHPHGLDPNDAYIRIAPSMPSLEDVAAAAEGLVACVRLAAAELG
ncbi:aminotransferase class I/II-fold pyridoxal phosphate-dependent enzyme [Brevibacterium ravenspurgense]|uniref:aminotransferase class I/II-fold pyridoxal phosphate-dependent enzyme n=1 Tax=Brevibacterium ravenspurgense TaxID=479117 RepID=UPI001EF3BD74|nr:aminotransferase class I/II-fold pyridoxal phosphate-dependent enzyme [Brevibacterium ravenspurgense]MCG7299877.1 aminotransferase class I/II-fold pyridoxal phosphate-dependent enzyme [Brevibacterium ravenspurgense]